MTPQEIKSLRTRLGLSQTEFAIRVGVASPARVSDWERGVASPDRRSRISLEKLAAEVAAENGRTAP